MLKNQKIFSDFHIKTLAFFFLIGYNKQAFVKRVSKLNATVAQSVEQLIRNQQVAGSSPASSSKNTRNSPKVGFGYFFIENTPVWAFCIQVN